MIIAYIRLSSENYGSNDELLITDKKVEDKNIEVFEIPYNTPLADKIFETVASSNDKFQCNGIAYQIISYIPENKKIERKFNKYRTDPRFIPPINLVKHKKIVIYVVNRQTACENKHNTFTLRANVLTVDKKEVIIEINYCKNCNIYFIRYSQLMAYNKKFDGISINISTKFMFFETSGSVWGRAQSELKLLGYSVNKQDALSARKRRDILTTAIDNHTLGLTKAKVMSHLSNLIERAPYNPKWYDAAEIWEQDLKFIQNYKSEKELLYTNGKLKRK